MMTAIVVTDDHTGVASGTKTDRNNIIVTRQNFMVIFTGKPLKRLFASQSKEYIQFKIKRMRTCRDEVQFSCHMALEQVFRSVGEGVALAENKAGKQ